MCDKTILTFSTHSFLIENYVNSIFSTFIVVFFLCEIHFSIFIVVFSGVFGEVKIKPNGDRDSDYLISDMTDTITGTFEVCRTVIWYHDG